MTDKEVMQMALDALELLNGAQTTDGIFIYTDQETKVLRAALAQPELNARELAKMHRSAWKNVRSEYKDDPECCFALGFDAGYDAVARRVEPPLSESGAGFESLPASPIAQPEPEPVAWMLTELDGTPLIDCGDLVVKPRPFLVSDKTDCIPLYTAPPKSECSCAECGKKASDGWALYCVKCSEPMREWVGLTDEEYEAMAEQHVTNCYFDTLKYAHAIEEKLKEKNT